MRASVRFPPDFDIRTSSVLKSDSKPLTSLEYQCNTTAAFCIRTNTIENRDASTDKIDLTVIC